MADNFPVITWIVYESGDTPGDIEVRANGSSQTLTLSTGGADVWGFGVDGSGNPSSDSLAERLAVCLETHTQISAVTPAYDWTGVTGSDGNSPANAYSGYPAVSLEIVKAGNNALDNITWSSASTTVTETNMGATSSDQTNIDEAATATAYLRFNMAGHWAPGLDGQLNVLDDRDERNIAFASFSPHEVSSGNISHTYWGQHTIRTLTWDIVDDAFIRAYRASDSTFAARAQRDVSDPNNLLETFLTKAAQGALFRIYTGNNTYRTAKMLDNWSISDLISPVSNSGARFRVTIPFVDLG